MTHEEIEKLGFLARIQVSPADQEVFAGDMDNILTFLKQIEEVDVSNVSPVQRFKNVTREDENPYPRGQYTEALLAEAPETLDGFIKVNKIL